MATLFLDGLFSIPPFCQLLTAACWHVPYHRFLWQLCTEKMHFCVTSTSRSVGLYVWQLFLIVIAASFFLFLISKICFFWIRHRIETRSRHLMERTHMDPMERGFFFSFLSGGADPGIPGSGESPPLRHNLFQNITRLPNQPLREEPCAICLESLQRNTVTQIGSNKFQL